MRKSPITIRRGAMIDSVTKEPVRVKKYPEAWPYIRLPLEQLDEVKTLLDRAGFHYAVNKYAVSSDGQPYTVVVNFEHRADIAALQRLLDDYQDREIVPSRR
jgi:hypothetical protein